MMNYSVYEILKGLRQRVNEDNELIIQTTGGNVEKARFEFFPSASPEELKFLSEKHEINLAPDYVDFLLLHNGAKLFDIGFGECTEIYSISQIIEKVEIMPDIAPGLLPIANSPSGSVFLDTTREEQNIFIQKGGSEFNFLSMDFMKWLEVLIIANGANFEEWTPLLLYRTIDENELMVKDWIIRGLKSNKESD